MKYVISWFERPQGSPMEYENAQKRILEVFGQWKAPGNFKIDFFVIRVGEWGGHLVPIILWVMQRGVIAREEAYLERRFGEEYRQYRARVRRWV